MTEVMICKEVAGYVMPVEGGAALVDWLIGVSFFVGLAVGVAGTLMSRIRVEQPE